MWSAVGEVLAEKSIEEQRKALKKRGKYAVH
jgi:hypothetical protein